MPSNLQFGSGIGPDQVGVVAPGGFPRSCADKPDKAVRPIGNILTNLMCPSGPAAGTRAANNSRSLGRETSRLESVAV